jgi:glutamate---cysteine ligase / carboxylate-amine ligase
VIEAHFGESAPFSLGVEEEVMILDGHSYAQVPEVQVLARETPAGRLKTELFASVVELNTPICVSAGAALESLRALRVEAARAAAEHGLAIAAAGTHPLSIPEEQTIADEERYRRFVDYAGATARRQGVNGLHVHVGMPSADACFAVMEAVLPWLPVVLALSANSPYLAGRETGLLSARAEVLGILPRSGAPPVFGSYEGWERYVERLRATGLPLTADYTSCWWDVRLHPRFGTLEIRMPDQPTSLAVTAAFVALVQALCKTVADRAELVAAAADRGDYQQNRWAAARFGPRAELIHPDGTRAVRAAELVVELLELVRPAGDELGSSDLLAAFEPFRCEADRQLEVGRAEGLNAVCADLVARSVASG